MLSNLSTGDYTNLSSRIEKQHQTLITDFYEFFLKSSFFAFSDIFKNHQLHILKSFYVFYFM